MSALAGLLLLSVLLSRMPLHLARRRRHRQPALGWLVLIAMLAIQVLLLLPLAQTWWAAIPIASLLVLQLAAYLLDRHAADIRPATLVPLAAQAALCWLWSTPFIMGTANGLDAAALTRARASVPGISRAGWVLAGLFLATNEANLVVRYAFQAMGMAPTPNPSPQSVQLVTVPTYRAGRMIGVLERALIYVLVLTGEYGLIGFVLAAKSFARFEQLKERAFAEYVLIGTLLSVLLGLLCALMTLKLLS